MVCRASACSPSSASRLLLIPADLSVRREAPVTGWVLYGYRAIVVQHPGRLCGPQSAQVNNQERAHGCVCTYSAGTRSRFSAARRCAESVCCAADAQVFAMRRILGTFFCAGGFIQSFCTRGSWPRVSTFLIKVPAVLVQAERLQGAKRVVGIAVRGEKSSKDWQNGALFKHP